MFNLPDFPDVYTTRHITCVSCKEKFAVTEGHQAPNPNDSVWRMRPNVPNTINLYYEDRRQQRPVVPTSRQTPLPPEGLIGTQQPFSFTPQAINCPRCGADNRNWLALTRSGNLPQHILWQQRFSGVFSAFYVGAAFVVLAIVLIFLLEIHLGKAAIMLVFIPAAILGIIWEITREWDALRENRHVRHILPKTKNKEKELWLRGFALVGIFTVVLPVLFFSLTPTAFRTLRELIEDNPENEVNVAATAVSQVLNQQIDATEEEFAAIADEMQELINSLPKEDLPQIEAELEALSNKLANSVDVSAISMEQLQAENAAAIEARRNEEMAAVTNARKRVINGLADGLVADMKFLVLWGLVVGIPSFVTVFISMAALKRFVGRVDRDLPPLIFYSVANMTRLVTWEARQALEVGEQHFKIQWTSVERNEQGGIDLVGLFRDPPEFDIFGQVRSPMVRAQRHIIHTDKWCRVVNASITDVMVPIPAGAPAGVMQLVSESQHDAPANVRIRLPER